MIRSRLTATLLAAAAVTTITAAAPSADPAGAQDRPSAPQCDGGRRGRLDIVGLVGDMRLVCFREDRPGRVQEIGRIRGLDNEPIVGIDFRVPFTDANGVSNGVPARGALYGLGRQGGVYTIDLRTGAATRRARLDVPLEGNSFGVDFNPTVDRLRIVSDTGQNLRANVDSGATIRDSALNNAGAPATGVTAVAYTNNDTDPATATTLYDIDTAADQLSIQNPPNNGTLTPVGALTVDTGAVAGFDLYSVTVSRGRGVRSTVDVRGFAVLSTGSNRASLYRIAPFSGRAISVGRFDRNVVDLAIPPAQ
jgi:hypothetical protein